MDGTTRVFAISILILFLLFSGCVQESEVREKTFATYSHPDTGFMIKYPQTWDIIYEDVNGFRLTFSSPDKRASFQVNFLGTHHQREGEMEAGVGLSYEVPNSTTIESFEKTQLAGIDGLKWTFIVENPDRTYYDKKICVIQKCPSSYQNRRTFCFDYDYDVGDEKMEKTLQAMLDSINLTCPLVN